MDASGFSLILNPRFRIGTDYSLSLNQRKNFLVVKPPGYKSRTGALLDPFNMTVWIGLITSFLGMWLSMFLVGKYAPQLRIGSFETFSTALGMVINEGVPNKYFMLRRGTARKILLLTWLPMACLLSMAYTSNLLASLVKMQQDKPIDTFQEVLALNIPIYFNSKTLAKNLMASSPIPIVNEAYEKQGKLYDLPDAEVFQFAEDTIASGGAFDNIEMRMHGNKHQWRIGKHLSFYSTPVCYHMAINNPILANMSASFGRMVDSGLYKGMQDKYIFEMEFRERAFYRNRAHESAWHELSLGHLSSAFWIFGILAMSVMSFLVERFHRCDRC